jgi:hypothetical protein
MRETARDTSATTRQALMFWNGAIDPRVPIVQRYFECDRKLELPADLAGEVLRWHPDAGAILALFRTIETGEPRRSAGSFSTLTATSSSAGS